MCLRVLLFLGCAVLVHHGTLGFAIREEGSPCDMNKQDVGTCTLTHKCPPAVESIKINHRHFLPRCGFSGLEEIVCCPDEPEPTTTTSKTIVRGPVISRSAQACDEYVTKAEPRIEYQILGGEDAKLGEFPHMAALGYESDDLDTEDGELAWRCGGSLISDRYVVTAAHCIVKRDDSLPVKVRLGVIDNQDTKNARDFDVQNITVHPDYNGHLKINDIALIRLATRVVSDTNMRPACLYPKSNDPKGLVVTGWGDTKFDGEGSRILQKARLEPIGVVSCNNTYSSTPASRSIGKTQFCAKSDDGTKDSCQGDSGGPLQVQDRPGSSMYSIVGITSYGKACGGTYPGVYTRVYSFTSWIESVVWP